MLLLLAGSAMGIAAADAAAAERVVIGVIPEVNLVKQMHRFEPLIDYLARKSGVDVEVKPLSNYGQLFEEMRDGNIDAGFFGSLVYGITRARIGIEPVVRPVQLNGSSRYSGILFIRKDAGIRKPADMKGKTIALADPATSGGYLSQREYFAAHGIDMERELRIYWAGSHEAAVRAVLSHQADIGGAKSTVVAKMRQENRIFDSVTDIIDDSPKEGLPDNTFAVRKGVDRKLREQLARTLLTMHKDPEGKRVLENFGARRFIVTSDRDFMPMYHWVKHLKIDLANYPYKRGGR